MFDLTSRPASVRRPPQSADSESIALSLPADEPKRPASSAHTSICSSNFGIENVVESHFRKSRIPSLYSNFYPLRLFNPDGFQANVDEWASFFEKVTMNIALRDLISENALVISADQSLVQSLSISAHGPPLALPTVFDASIQNCRMMLLSDFMNSKKPRAITRILHSVVGFLSWALGSKDDLPEKRKMINENVVLLNNIERLGRKIDPMLVSLLQEGGIGDILTLKMFKKILRSQLIGYSLSDLDCEVLIKILLQRQKIILRGETVKIVDPSDSQSVSITDSDLAVGQLKNLYDELEIHIQSLRIEFSDVEREIRSIIRKSDLSAQISIKISTETPSSQKRGLSTELMHLLKRKKRIQRIIEQRLELQNQILQFLHSINQALTNKKYVDVVKSSTLALQSVLIDMGGVEEVEKVLQKAKSQIAESDEIEHLLKSEDSDDLLPDLSDSYSKLSQSESDLLTTRSESEKEDLLRELESLKIEAKESSQLEMRASAHDEFDKSDSKELSNDQRGSAQATVGHSVVEHEVANMPPMPEGQLEEPVALH